MCKICINAQNQRKKSLLRIAISVKKQSIQSNSKVLFNISDC